MTTYSIPGNVQAALQSAFLQLSATQFQALTRLISESPTLISQLTTFVAEGHQISFSVDTDAGDFNPNTVTIDITIPSLTSNINTSATNPFATTQNRESATGTLDSTVVGRIVEVLAHELGHFEDYLLPNPYYVSQTSPYNQAILAADGLLGEGRAVYNEATVASEIAANSKGSDQIDFYVTQVAATDISLELGAVTSSQQIDAPILASYYAVQTPSGNSSTAPDTDYLEKYWKAEQPTASQLAAVGVMFTNQLADGQTALSNFQENLSNVVVSSGSGNTAVSIDDSNGTLQDITLLHSDGTISKIAFPGITGAPITDTITGSANGTSSIQTVYSDNQYTDTILNSSTPYGYVSTASNPNEGNNITLETLGPGTSLLTEVVITSQSDLLSGFSEEADGTLVTLLSSVTGTATGNISTTNSLDDMTINNDSVNIVTNNTSVIVNGSGNTITVGTYDNITVTGEGSEKETINVSTGADATTDTLTFEGKSVAGSAQSGVADTANGFTYTLTDTTLSIAGTGGDQLTLNDFVDGDFGITITKPDDPAYPPDPRDPKDPPRVPSKAIQQTTSQADTSMTDPIVFDMGGNGIQLTALASSTAYFDLQGTGVAQHTGWVGPTTGILQRASIIAQLSHAMQPVFH